MVNNNQFENDYDVNGALSLNGIGLWSDRRRIKVSQVVIQRNPRNQYRKMLDNNGPSTLQVNAKGLTRAKSHVIEIKKHIANQILT